MMNLHPLTSDDLKIKAAEQIFEKLAPRELALFSTPVLSMFSMGLTTALVVEVGHGVTSATPIYEGYPLPYATYSSDLGGQDVR